MTVAFVLPTAGGSPLNLPRTLLSHGVASLPPAEVDEQGREMRVTLAAGSGRAFSVRVSQHSSSAALLEISGAPDAGEAEDLARTVRHMLRLDEDLSPFYRKALADPDLAWAAAEGAGRMMRSATVFEDVVKTVCTTNCTWSATVRMVTALVTELGTRAQAGAGADGAAGASGNVALGTAAHTAFPPARAMADQPDEFYARVVRAGYRGPYLRAIAAGVASGDIELEELAREHPAALTDDEVERTLLALPGVGPYAAAHVMMLLGRCSRLVFDSWTVPKYRRLVGKPRITQKGITRRFRGYGDSAGLAFWLFLTRDWV